MRELKRKLCTRENIYGTMLSEITMPNIVKIYKVCGFEFFIIDCEHGAFDYSSVSNLTAMARAVKLPSIVRIPKVDRECILKYLDMGADGILIPMVSSATDVKQVVEFAKYAPQGSRGVSTLRAHTGYNSSGMAEYIKKANEDTMIIAQIESNTGLENIGEILQVQGLDGVVIGPNDLSMEMGLLGQFDHPLVQGAIDKVIIAAKDAGLWSGIISSNKQLLKQSADKGVQFISWNSEVGMITASAKDGLQSIKG